MKGRGLLSDARYQRGRYLASVVNKRYRELYRKDPNIQGTAFGRRMVDGQFVDEPAVVIYVARKVASRFLPPSRQLPRRLYVGSDSIEVDVHETGPIYAHSFTATERPSPSGISVGRATSSPADAGTFGALVNDLLNPSGVPSILSNNHVLANENAGSPGDIIVQAGTLDGGSSPFDDIAKLTRFVNLNAVGNVVDGAIAQVGSAANVINLMKNNLMPVPSPSHRAVGLLFAGGCNRTYMNPIADVLSQLNVEFLAGPGSTVTADIGMNVEKVGRTTEYTTSTITEVDVSITVGYNTLGSLGFDHQIATAWMSDPGDSGSVICEGGKGGNEDKCGGGGTICATTQAAETILGTDLSLDVAAEKEFRTKYLQYTRVGRYFIDTYFANEARLCARVEQTAFEDADLDFIRSCYNKYIDQIRACFVRPDLSPALFTTKQVFEIKELHRRFAKYMEEPDAKTSGGVLDLLLPLFQGKTLPDILTIMDSEELLQDAKNVVGQ